MYSPLKTFCLFVFKKEYNSKGKKRKVLFVNPLMLRKAGCEAGICFRTKTNKAQACICHTPRLKGSNNSLSFHQEQSLASE